MPYSLLLGILFLFLFLLLLNLLGQRPLRESFVDIRTNPAVQKWMDFQTNEFCPLWTEMMDIARKNDQVDVQQLSLPDYCKKVQDDWNRSHNTTAVFVTCDTPVTKEMPLSKLLAIVPEGPQNYLENLYVLNAYMANAIQQVNDALANEGFTSLKEGFDESTEKTTICTSSDGTTTTTTRPKTPEEQQQEAQQTSVLMTRIQAILKDLDTIKAEMTKAKQQKAQLDVIKKKGENGSLYSKDGTIPVAKQYTPTKTRLFFN